MHLKKNDIVVVLSGKDSNKTGEVIAVFPKSGKVLIKGINVAIKHIKARRQGESAGIKELETSLEISKVMPVCSSCKKPTRVNMKIAENGKKNRICNKCQEMF